MIKHNVVMSVDKISVVVSVDDIQCIVKSPYHPIFVKFARNFNGKWVAPTHWAFDRRDEKLIRQTCYDIYGTDGAEVPCVNVELNLDQYKYGGNPWFGMGRLLVRRRSMKSEVQLGHNVVVVAGGFPKRAGTTKNPSCESFAGTILEVRDVPESIVINEMQ